MKKIQTLAAPQSIEAGPLDAVRASKLLTMIGVKSAELLDTSEGNLVFGVPAFNSALLPLTKFYGAPKNESNVGWSVKRLVWSVPEVQGQVMLMQVGKMGPLLIFKQL